MGLWVWGLGFGVGGLGFGVWGLGFGVLGEGMSVSTNTSVYGLGFRGLGGVWVDGLGCRAQGVG